MSLSDKKKLRNEIRGSGFTMDQVAEAMNITKPTLYARISKLDEDASILQNVKDAIKKLSVQAGKNLITAKHHGDINIDDIASCKAELLTVYREFNAAMKQIVSLQDEILKMQKEFEKVSR